MSKDFNKTVKNKQDNKETNSLNNTQKSVKREVRRPQQSNKKGKKSNLKVMFLGGIGEVGKNLTVFEYENDIIVVDCGLMFPDEDMLGIDLVIPDVTYLIENRDKIRGFVVTHGHEDHIGSFPYVLGDIKAPIYGSNMTIALIQKKMEEFKKISYKTNVVKPRQKIKLGCFEIEFITVNHSVAGSYGLAITTPVGVVVHSGDFKIDYTPVQGNILDLHRFAEYGSKGVLLYMADSTNAERPGFSMSERVVSNTFEGLFDEHKDRRIIIATFASNVHRLQEIMNIAERHKRKVVFTGRSMVNVTDIASKNGEMVVNKGNILDIEKIKNCADNELCIISTGSQGEPMSALTRMANGDFKGLEIGPNDTIIFSSSPIPGNEKSVNNVINKLIMSGAEVIYNQLEQVHASGHACREELKTMFALVKPKYFIPVHGEQKHLIAHKAIAESMGIDKHNIICPLPGAKVEVNDRMFKITDSVPYGVRLIDGAGVGEMESNVLKERKQLSEDGLCVVILNINPTLGKFATRPEIISRGFTYTGEALTWLEDAKDVVIDSAENIDLTARDYVNLKINIRKKLTNFLDKKLKRRPMIVPIIVESK
ncbi:MAG: ribonuclease J [Clostridia bacterium]|nr:ribonuclease J [Clostridia bacterium]